jgi:rod shape-determining protein MreC
MFVRQMGLPARLTIYLALGVILMAADTRYAALERVRAGAAVVFHPLQAFLARPFLYFSEASEFFIQHAELLRTQQALEAEQVRLRTRLQAMQTLEADNQRLRALMALPTPTGFQQRTIEVARVLPDPFARRLVINLGASAGIRAGYPVVDARGLVGQVTRVYAGSSEVTLLTSQEQSAPVQVVRNGLRLIITGLGVDDRLEIRYLDAHADLKSGDVLTTSGLDGVYPAGIPVARVLRVDPPGHTPFARAVCEPLAGTGQGRHLSLLQPAR